MRTLAGCLSIGGVVYIPVLAFDMLDAPGLVAALGFLWVFCAGIAVWSFRHQPSPGRIPDPTFWQRRQAKILANGGSYTRAEFGALCAQYDNRCLCCGGRAPLAADHIVPVEHGGSSDISNIQPLCKPCNSRKGTRTIDYRSQ
jgi:hypothetical protein